MCLAAGVIWLGSVTAAAEQPPAVAVAPAATISETPPADAAAPEASSSVTESATPVAEEPPLDETERLRRDAEAASARGAYEEAARLHAMVHERLRAERGADDLETIKAANNLALAYGAVGRTAEALALLQEALAWCEAKLGASHPFTLSVRHNLATALLKRGDYASAHVEIERTLALRSATLGADDPDTLRTLNDLGVVLNALGRYEEARVVDERTLAARERVLGPTHPDTLVSLNNLAETYVSLGRYADALPLHERAFRQRTAILGETHPLTLQSLNNLTATYGYLGRHADALPLYERAVELFTKVMGAQHPDTLTVMSNLASAYTALNRPGDALALHEKILAARTATLGERHPATLATVANIAAAYFAMARYDAALPYAERALHGQQSLYGEAHPDTVRALQNLATIELHLGRFDAAMARYEQALAAGTTLLGRHHPANLAIVQNLATLYYGKGRYEEAAALYERLIEGVEHLRASGDLSAENRQALFARWVVSYKDYVRLLVEQGRVARAFEVAELSKARTLLEASTLRQANLAAFLEPAERERLRRYEDAIARFNEQLGAALDDPQRRLALEGEKNAVLQEFAEYRRALAAKYPKYAALTDVRIVTAEQGAASLPEDAVFVSYLVRDDTVIVFTLTREGRLAGQVLPAARELGRTLEAYRLLLSLPPGASPAQSARVWRLADGSYRVAAFPPTGNAVLVREASEIAAYLTRLLIAPFAAELAQAKRWIVSPDGALALLPFETLPLAAGRPAIMDHDVGYVQSLSMYAVLKERVNSYGTQGERRALFALGGAPYAVTGESPAAAMADGEIVRRDIRWQDLPASALEVERVSALFPPDERLVLLGEEASEKRLLELDAAGTLANYRYLLFSAHGYLDTDQPMSSAVVLSQRDVTPHADGYVTASEWMRYALRSDLIVLSACETAVGRVVQGEGITGLPFALYVAGNTNTLLSLWPVLDESTARFMESFFAKLGAGMDQLAALSATKREFMANATSAAPVYWAPFVLYGI